MKNSWLRDEEYILILMANLFFVHYPETPVLIPNKGKATIGRADNSTIVLTEPRVSRHHAQIEWQDARNNFIFFDLGSANGSFLNAKKLPPLLPHTIHDRDKIRIASTVFTVRFMDDPAIIQNEFKELRRRVHREMTEVIDASDFRANMAHPAFSGDLEHLCVIELFQMLESGRKTGMLSLKTDIGEGSYAVEKGRIISARFGDLFGDKAVFEALKASHGPFAFNPQADLPENRQITLTITSLLMEGCRLLDEAGGSPTLQ
jgi:pSer/pThr/pTyr-binding forkhead associated (FHA) protein